MTPKLVTNKETTYINPTWSGRNNSEIYPIGDAVLVVSAEASKMVGKRGLIMAPDDLVSRQSAAAETGLVVAVGDSAFSRSRDRTGPFTGRKPAPGDIIYFARYAGQTYQGADGVWYRLMSDDCIAGVGPERPASEPVRKSARRA